MCLIYNLTFEFSIDIWKYRKEMVFELIVKGHTTHEIERILHVSHGTVCGDMKEIRQQAKQVVANYFNQ